VWELWETAGSSVVSQALWERGFIAAFHRTSAFHSPILVCHLPRWPFSFAEGSGHYRPPRGRMAPVGRGRSRIESNEQWRDGHPNRVKIMTLCERAE